MFYASLALGKVPGAVVDPAQAFFPHCRVEALDVDGGSEFQAQFETACQGLGVRLFVLTHRCPKLNGHVGRAQRIHTEEFHESYDGDFEIGPSDRALLNCERL